MIAPIASLAGMPLNSPESTSTSSAVCATKASPSGSSPDAGRTTYRIGNAYVRAKAPSRSSWAGTAMIAPVP